MATEPFVIDVSDGGTAAEVINLLLKLGEIGEDVLTRIALGQERVKTSAAAMADQETLVNAAYNAGAADVSVLDKALSALTEVQLRNIAANSQAITGIQDIGLAYQVAGARAAEATAALANTARVMQDLRAQQVMEDVAATEKQELAAAKAEADKLAAAESATAQYQNLYALRVLEDQQAYTAQEQAAAAAERAKLAAAESATAQYQNLYALRALEDEKAYSDQEAAAAASARVRADLEVQAQLEIERADAARAAAAAKYAADETAAYAENARLTALAAEQAAAQRIEAEAQVQRATIESAMLQGNVINAMYDKEKAAAASAAAERVASANASVAAFGGLIVTLGLVASAATVVSDINVVDKINQQLASTVGTGKAAADTFNHLAGTATSVQQPLESVASAFNQIYGAIKANGGTIEKAEALTDALSKGLYATGVSGQAAARVIHDFSEGLAQGSLGGQQLTSALRQAPGMIEKLGEALGVNVQQLTGHAQQVERVTARLDTLKAAAAGSGTGFTTATGSVAGHTAALQRVGTEIDATNNKLTAAEQKYGANSTQVKTLTTELAKQREEYASESAALGQSTAANDSRTASETKAKNARVANTEAILKSLQGLSAEQIEAALLSKKFADAVTDGITATGTLSGAVTNVNTAFERYLNNTGEANTVTQLFKDAMSFLAKNMDTIIPIVTGLGIAFVGLKLVQVVEQFSQLKSVVGLTRTAGQLLVSLLNPWTAAIIAIGVAVYAVGQYFGLWSKAIDYVKAQYPEFAAAIGLGTNATDKDTKSVQANTQAIEDNAKAKLAAYNAEQMKTFGLAGGQNTNDGQGGNIGYGGYSALNPRFGTGSAATGYDPAPMGTSDPVPANTTPYTGLQDVPGLGASRDGSSFTVPGGGGVDSRVMRVSPGEVVTVQTPMQAKNGVVNDNVPRFRDGGVLTPFTASDASIAGYKADSGFTSAGAAATTDDYSYAASAAAQAAVIQAATTAAVAATKAVASQTVSNAAPNSVVGDGSGSGTGTVAGTYDTSAGPGSTYTSALPTASAYTAHAKAVADAAKAVRDASVVTTANGVAKPTGTDINQTITTQQANNWEQINGVWEPKFNTAVLGYAGDRASAYKTFLATANAPIAARDGIDMVIPGGTGVDTKLLHLAVSPGERVAVTTPMQDQNARGQKQNAVAPRSRAIVVNITTDNADTFRKSASQVASDLKRKLGKVA